MTVGGVTTDYAYDGTMLVREFQTNQQTGLLAPSVTYMVGPMGPCCRINEQNQSDGYYPAGVTSTTPLTRGVTRWYVYDGLGSVVGELDDNNNITTSRQYDVYGASVFALSDYSLFRKDTSDQLNSPCVAEVWAD
jgi:YD repeat-containing protein